MLIEIARCDKHTGDAHPPRCADCDAEQVKAAADEIEHRLSRVHEYPNYKNRQETK